MSQSQMPVSSEQDLPEICVLPELLTKKHNQFQCCCGRVHVYTAAKCLLAYHSILFTCLILAFFRESAELLGPMFALFVATGWSLMRGRAELLWPFIIYTACSTILFILFSAYLFFYATLKKQYPVEEIVISSLTGQQSSHIPYLLPFILHTFNLLLCAFHCWQVVVLLATRRFLKRVQIVKRERLFRQDSLSIQTTTSCD